MLDFCDLSENNDPIFFSLLCTEASTSPELLRLLLEMPKDLERAECLEHLDLEDELDDDEEEEDEEELLLEPTLV